MRKNNRIAAVVLAASLIQMGCNIVSPVLASIQERFSTVPLATIQMLVTLPSAFTVAFSLLSAGISGRISKKYTLALGCGAYCLGGLLAFTGYEAFWMLLLCACLMGAGIGVTIPTATSLIADYFTPSEQPKIVGYQTCAAQIGAVLITFLGGILAQIRWQCCYLAALICVPGLLLSLLILPKGEGQVSRSLLSALSILKDRQIRRSLLMGFLVTMLFNVAPTGLSILLSERGTDSTAYAGYAISLLLLGGAVGGWSFGRLPQRLRGYAFTLGFACMAAGFGLCAWAGSVLGIYLGCFIGGASISLVMPAVICNVTARAEAFSSEASALCIAFSNLGAFLTPLITLASAGWQMGKRFTLICAVAAAISLISFLARRSVVRRVSSG